MQPIHQYCTELKLLSTCRNEGFTENDEASIPTLSDLQGTMYMLSCLAVTAVVKETRLKVKT